MSVLKTSTTMLFIFALASCATVDVSKIEDTTLRKKAEVVKLAPSYEAFMLREDLVRATHTETTTSTVNGRSVTTTKQVPNEYSELVIDFGNGIIMDYNENLCIDLIKLYDLTQSNEFFIERSGKGFMQGKKYFTLKDNVFNTNYESKREVLLNNDEIKIESGLFKSNRTININDNRISLTGKFLGLNINKEARKTDIQTIEVKGFWKDDKFIMTEPGHVSMGKYFEIKNEADYISITYTGIFGITTSMKCFVTQDGIIFIDKNNRGLELTKNGNVIQVIRNNKKAAEYIIN